MKISESPKPSFKALRSIALFEAAKGAVVILAGFGLLALIHQDLQNWGEEVIRHLHMNPAHRFPRIFLKALSQVKPSQIEVLALGAVVYSIMRFVEAYGLWKDRAWAEWLAIFSCALYLPMEFYDLWKKATVVRSGVTFFNLGIFFYLVWVRRMKMKNDFSSSDLSASSNQS